MSHESHLERYKAIKDAFLAACVAEGCEHKLVAYAVIGIDENGEAYYGACVGPERIREMKSHAAWLLTFCKEQEKRYAKEPQS